jgi:hypothetical protein
MTISRKPKGKASAAVDVDALIRKGGSMPATETHQVKPKAAAVILRIPTDILERVNQAVETRLVKIPRHTWILEAIVEKLDKESQ